MFQQTTPTLFHSKEEMEEMMLNHCTALMKSVPLFPSHIVSRTFSRQVHPPCFSSQQQANFSGGRNSLYFVDAQWWSPLAFECVAGCPMSFQPIHGLSSRGQDSFAGKMFFYNNFSLTSVDRLTAHVCVLQPAVHDTLLQC